MNEEPRHPARHEWSAVEPDHPAPLATRRLIRGERMMVARFVLEQGFHMEPHVHHNEQISVIVQGKLLFRVADPGSDEFHEVVVAAGQVMTLPAFAPHAATALERSVVFDLFSPPSDQTGVDQG